MPHYVDGTPAQIGDIAQGKGYNIKDENGDLKEIVGLVVGITESHRAFRDLSLSIDLGCLGTTTQ
jgi:hypothetical protein